MESQTISVLGAGWLGLPLAARLAEAGHAVRASSTTAERLGSIREVGATPHRIEIGERLVGERVPAFFEVDVLIVMVPPSGVASYPAMARTIAEAAEQFGTGRLVFTSSTSVYADLNRVVTEADAGPRDGLELPRNGEAVWQAERVFAEAGAVVLRLAGLIGGERHPVRYLAGRADLPNGDAPVNLVHRDDVIAGIEAVFALVPRGETFNLCADDHPTRRAYYTASAESLGLAPPAFQAERTAWKSVSNAKSRRLLGLRYERGLSL